MTNKEKFLALVSKEETKTVERAKARLANKKFSQLSNQIAFEILERLDQLRWKQKDLAGKMGVSPQQVSKWVKGRENFTIETLVNLGEVLHISLIEVKQVTGNFEKIENGKVSSAHYERSDKVIKFPVPTKISAKSPYSSQLIAR